VFCGTFLEQYLGDHICSGIIDGMNVSKKIIKNVFIE